MGGAGVPVAEERPGATGMNSCDEVGVTREAHVTDGVDAAVKRVQPLRP